MAAKYTALAKAKVNIRSPDMGGIFRATANVIICGAQSAVPNITIAAHTTCAGAAFSPPARMPTISKINPNPTAKSLKIIFNAGEWRRSAVMWLAIDRSAHISVKPKRAIGSSSISKGRAALPNETSASGICSMISMAHMPPKYPIAFCKDLGPYGTTAWPANLDRAGPVIIITAQPKAANSASKGWPKMPANACIPNEITTGTPKTAANSCPSLARLTARSTGLGGVCGGLPFATIPLKVQALPPHLPL